MADIAVSNKHFVDAVVRHHNGFADYFSNSYVQVITIVPGPVTFAVADSPVVLSDRTRQAGSSMSPLALKDADEVWFPTGPRTGIAMSHEPVPDCVMTSSEAQQLNDRVWRWANSRLLCSPADGPHNAFGRPARRLPEAPTG